MNTGPGRGTAAAGGPAPVAQPLRTGIWLVPTERLRRTLLTAEWNEQEARGVRVAQMPVVLLPEHFAADYAMQSDREQPCLPPGGDAVFWMDAASELDPGIDPARAHALAGLAEEAFALECAWELATTDPSGEVSEDVAQYLKLRTAFLKRLAEAGFEPRARLLQNLVADLESGAFGQAHGLLAFHGFDECTPLERRLARAWESRGGRFCEIPVETRPQAACRAWAFPDREAEIYAAAQFARRSLIENPEQKIGVIVIGLERLRQRVRAIFDDVLAPPRLTGNPGPVERPYNLSLGEPLSHYPLIETALDILEAAAMSRSPLTWSRLLRSPYWGDPSRDGLLRFAADRSWREQGRNGDTGLDLASRVEPCPDFFRRAWQRTGERLACSGLEQRQSLAHWIELWSGLLEDFGWPGAQTLDSVEYQTHAAWNETLEEVASLGSLPQSWSFRDFHLLVTEALRSRLFQPETPPCPIEIMGPLETAGLSFDRIWVIGAEAHSWPPEPHPHPFLPYALQRAHHLPHASSQREFQFNQKLLIRWQHSCQELVVSSTRREDDRDLDPSPLIAHWPAPELQPSERCGFRRTAPGRACALEVVAFTEPVARPAGEIKGGIRYLKDQATCPFQGFATHRLRAEPLPPWQFGFDARMRGLLLHAMLERIFKKLHTYQPNAWNPARIETTITQAVETTLCETPVAGPLERVLRDTLRPSLTEWLCTWFLDHESTRQDHFEIETEARTTITLGGLQFACRADRIDQKSDGTLVIIDYKTGQPPSIRHWEEGHLTEPQLPVYALAWPETRAVLVACLKPERMGYTGLVAEPNLLPKSRRIEAVAHWEALQRHWREELERLAHEIEAGRNDLEPYQEGASLPCDRCPYPALCRLHETRIEVETAPGEAESEGNPA